MKVIETDGITYIKPIPGATSEWYYGLGFEQGDLYEAEQIFKSGNTLKGRKFCIVHYPDGTVYSPLREKADQYCGDPVFFEESIYILNVDFRAGQIYIIRFDCTDHKAEAYVQIPLDAVTDCYNLMLQTAPLTLTRQCVGRNEFEIVWPEKTSFPMDDHDSFFLRDGNKLFFNRWYEEGEGEDYEYWEETIVKDLSGNVIERLSGDVMLMPNGELWHLKKEINDSICIKSAETDEELCGRGYVHCTAWQEAYRGIVCDRYLDTMTVEATTARARRFPENTLVAKYGEKVVGFAVYSASRDEDLMNAGEIDAIYVLSEYYDRKIGYRLMNEAFSRLSEYNTIFLWVFEKNERAIRFYHKYGFEFDGCKKEWTLGTPVTIVRMVYHKQDLQG